MRRYLDVEFFLVNMVLAAFRYVRRIASCALNYLANFCIEHSRERRYVAYVLDKEKAIFKRDLPDVSVFQLPQ